jgi:hypothetical protein
MAEGLPIDPRDSQRDHDNRRNRESEAEAPRVRALLDRRSLAITTLAVGIPAEAGQA